MPQNIEFDHPMLEHLEGDAGSVFRKKVTEFADDLLDEAARLEVNYNDRDKKPEITSGFVNDASYYLRRGLAKKKKDWVDISTSIGGPLSALLIGIIYSADNMQNPIFLSFFVILMVVSITCIVLSVFRG